MNTLLIRPTHNFGVVYCQPSLRKLDQEMSGNQFERHPNFPADLTTFQGLPGSRNCGYHNKYLDIQSNGNISKAWITLIIGARLIFTKIKYDFKKIGVVTIPVRQHQDTWLHHLLLCSDFRGPAPWFLQHAVELAKDAHFRGGTGARGPWGGNGRRRFTTVLLLLGQELADAAHQVAVIKSVVELQAIRRGKNWEDEVNDTLPS